MAEANISDSATQERIIKHMNADHPDSLSRYLEHHCNISQTKANRAELTEITLHHMIIASSAGRNIVFFDPPLKSWNESRPRLVQMDEEARAALGRSPITVREYAWPRPFHAAVGITAILGFLLSSRRQNLLPGSFLYDTFLYRHPSLTGFLKWTQTPTFYTIIALHLGEPIWLDRSRLVKHNVARFSKLWFKWIVSNIFEGFGAFQRFDDLVSKQRKEKERAKH